VGKHGAAKHQPDGPGDRPRGARALRSAPAHGTRALQSVDGGEAPEADGASEGALALDRLIHERMRLGIVSALAVNDTLTFNDLKRLMHTTDGNLSVHARKLEDAAYVTCTKSFQGRVPKTEYRLTAAGRRALERYLDHMEALIRATRER
jgi:DNA-binding HxlR family transcriptional regulator